MHCSKNDSFNQSQFWDIDVVKDQCGLLIPKQEWFYRCRPSIFVPFCFCFLLVCIWLGQCRYWEHTAIPGPCRGSTGNPLLQDDTWCPWHCQKVCCVWPGLLSLASLWGVVCYVGVGTYVVCYVEVRGLFFMCCLLALGGNKNR